MWPPWIKTRSQSPSSFSPSSPSLKDLQNLLANSSSPSLKDGGVGSVFHRVRLAASALRALQRALPPPPSPDHRRVVFYFTSLRIIRSTFSNCRSARSILRSLRISFDERDVSLDHRFLDELKSLLKYQHGEITLPQLFIGGRHIGGAEEIRKLHESGELKRLVDGARVSAERDLSHLCEGCGGEGFRVCENCSGSRKMYYEKGGRFRVCNDCNENGLRRCPDCSSAGF